MAVEGAGWVPRMVVSEAPGDAEVVIELARAVTVRVEVVDVAGESIDGARVRVEAAERGQVPIARWGVTSSGGPAEVTGVRPGAAVIEVSSPGYSPKQAGATLRPAT